MTTDEPFNPSPEPGRNRRGLKVALIGAGIAVGAIGATAYGASAATNSTSTAPTAYTQAGTPSGAPSGSAKAPTGAQGGSTPIRSDEKSVSTSVAATLKAAALKAVPGGTVYRIETDAGDGAYEAHMTKSDGTAVTVKFDENYQVIKVETGMGTGDPAPTGQPQNGH